MKTKLRKYGLPAIIILIMVAILAVVIWLLIKWPAQTILGLMAIGAIIEHWKTILSFVIIAAISSFIGFSVVWLVNFTGTGKFLMEFNKLWMVLLYFFVCIYIIGLIINEDNWKPYIYIWQKLKKLCIFLKKQSTIKLSLY